MVRRHARGAGGEQQHYGPALQTVTGNYVAAKRKASDPLLGGLCTVAPPLPACARGGWHRVLVPVSLRAPARSAFTLPATANNTHTHTHSL